MHSSNRGRKLGLLFVLPSLLLVVCFTYYPVFFGMYMSFNDYYMRPLMNPKFVFLGNYERLVNDSYFWNSLWMTALWVFVSVICVFLMGFGMSILLNEELGPLRPVARGLILLPWATPIIVSSLAWRWIFSYDYGILNKMLRDIGLGQFQSAWLGDLNLVWFSVFIFCVWRLTPFVCLTTLAGLQTVPPDLLEAAMVDGANIFQRFRHVTIPTLKPTIVAIILLTTIWGLNDFATIWTLTKGGPGRLTEVLSVAAYWNAFGTQSALNLGYAATYSVALFLISLIVTIVYLKRVGLE